MRKIVTLFLGGMLLLSLLACGSSSKQKHENANSEQTDPTASETKAQGTEETTFELNENLANELQILVEGGDGETIVFQLNGSSAANTLYEQLPLSIQVENYSHNEKIFYPPNELDTSDTPLAEGPAGTLAYYAPWGDVVLYYGGCEGASGLYALGQAVSGAGQIETLSGEIRIEAVNSD